MVVPETDIVDSTSGAIERLRDRDTRAFTRVIESMSGRVIFRGGHTCLRGAAANNIRYPSRRQSTALEIAVSQKFDGC